MRILQFGRLGAGHLPVIFGINFAFMLGATYVFAVYRGDVDPVFPYISASGDSRPESCLFSALLNICSFLSALIIFLRYSLVVELNRGSDFTLKFVNRLALYAGSSGAFGMFIVANFQETALIRVHLFGAFLCFGSGCVFMLLQTWISYRMHPLYAGKRVAHLRLILAILSTLCFFVSIVFGTAANNAFHHYFPDKPTPHPWSRKIGYVLHCISALAEWALAILHVAFMFSFSREFEKIRVEMCVQPLVSHLDQSPLWQSTDDLTQSPSSPYFISVQPNRQLI